MKRKLLSAFGLGVALTASSAFANTIAPGASAAPDLLTLGAGATSIASVSGTISPGTFTANYTETVYADPTNTFCAGCYDFVYSVSNVGATGVIERITGYSYDTTILTDVGYTPGSGTAPTTVDRSANGNVVGFNFLGSGEIAAGTSTDMLIIETNSKSFVSGLISIQDGSAGTSVAFGPGPVSTPEPVSMGLLGGGLTFLGLARLRKSKKS